MRLPAAQMMASGNDAIAFPFPDMNCSEVRVGIVKARGHKDIGDNLVAGIKASLAAAGVEADNIIETEVPGSFELPLACRYLALSGTVDVIVPIGVLIKDDSFPLVGSVTKGLMDVGLSTGVPVIFGVLTADTERQAYDRSEGKNNHGLQWGNAAVEMALLRASAMGRKGKKSFMGFGDNGEDRADAPLKGGKVSF